MGGSGIISLEKFLRHFRQLLADIAGQAIMNPARVNARHIRNHYRSRSRHGHNQPYDAKEQEARQRNQLQDQSMLGE